MAFQDIVVLKKEQLNKLTNGQTVGPKTISNDDAYLMEKDSTYTTLLAETSYSSSNSLNTITLNQGMKSFEKIIIRLRYSTARGYTFYEIPVAIAWEIFNGTTGTGLAIPCSYSTTSCRNVSFVWDNITDDTTLSFKNATSYTVYLTIYGSNL